MLALPPAQAIRTNQASLMCQPGGRRAAAAPAGEVRCSFTSRCTAHSGAGHRGAADRRSPSGTSTFTMEYVVKFGPWPIPTAGLREALYGQLGVLAATRRWLARGPASGGLGSHQTN